MRRVLVLAIALAIVPAARAQESGSPSGESARDSHELKRVGAKYRVKVASAGVPGLGGFLDGYACRTTYKVFDAAGKLQGTAFLNEYVYVDGPGDYAIEVHGRRVTESFVMPDELTQDRVHASWKRSRAVELRPKSGTRLTVPSIWVQHPPQVAGDHNDDYTISAIGEKGARELVAKGVAVVYAPEEIKDIDDGLLFENTLVHAWPGRYEIAINETKHVFELKAGQSKLLRLGALVVHEAKNGVFQGVLDGSEQVVPGYAMKAAPLGKFFVVVPGVYLEGDARVEIAPGGTGALHGVKKPFGDKPRLGIKTADAPDGSGAIIAGFVEGSAAAAAGVKVNDKVTAIDGKPVKSFDDLVKVLETKKPGDEVSLTVQRAGRSEPLEIKVKLGG